jgi:hypothetical protein
LTNNLPDRENQSASFESRSDENISDALPQPDTSGAIKRSDIKALRRNLGCLTTNFIPTDRKSLSQHQFAARPWLYLSVRSESFKYR